MSWWWYPIAGFAILVVGFVIWRWTSVGRGANRRDDLIFVDLKPIAERLEAGEALDANEVREVATPPQNRPLLYQMLKHFEKLELFPDEWRTEEEQAKAMLSYWMMHPNELQNPPEKIEVLESAERVIDGQQGRFYVLRYLMAEGHWAGSKWILGIAGPFFEGNVAFSGVAGAFSRCNDFQGEIEGDAIVDWFIKMVTGKDAESKS